MKGPANDSLRRRYFVLNCRPVIWIFISSVQRYRWRFTSPWKSDLRKWNIVNLARQRPVLFLQNQLIPNKHPYNSLLGDADRCSFESSSDTLTPAHSTSKPSKPSSYGHAEVPELLRGALLPNFSKMVERGILIMGIQQLEHTFSMVRMNLRAWLKLLRTQFSVRHLEARCI